MNSAAEWVWVATSARAERKTLKKPEVIAVGAVAFMLVAFAPWSPASAVEAERYDSYWRTTARICEGGVTPGIARGTEELASALARDAVPVEVKSVVGPTVVSKKVLVRTTDSPHGRTTNFWGPRPPQMWRSNCVPQAP